jgi:4-hydroxybenzoate polyprenyltransferase
MRRYRVARWGFDTLLYGHIWIAMCAVAMVVQTGFVLTARVEWTALEGFVAAGTWLAYTLHRLVAPTVQPSLRAAARFRTIGTYRRVLVWAAWPVAAVGAWCFLSLPHGVQFAVIVPGMVALLYPLPLYRGRRLRDVPFLKVFLIAATWAWITVALPTLLRGVALPTVWPMLLDRACFILALTLPFDIRDADSDRAQGVATLPTRWGIIPTQLVAYAALLGMAAAVGVGLHAGLYLLPQAALLWCFAGATALAIHYATPQRHDYYYTGLLDGLMLVQCIALVVLGV